MAKTFRQRFPRIVAGRVEHLEWEVDLDTARAFCPMGNGRSQRLVTELQEMAEHFGRWLLTVSAQGERVRCGPCGGMLVLDRGLRCVACGRAQSLSRLPRGTRLTWFGLLPPIGIDGLPRLAPTLLAGTPPEHLVGERPGLGRFILVPLCAAYPADFPEVQLSVHYQPGFFTIAGVPPPRPSHEVHLLTDRMMCLFAARQWRPEMTCREVLQQRAYAHVIKLLNYANGRRDAFRAVS